MKKSFIKKSEKLIRKMELCLTLCENILTELDFLDPTEMPEELIQKHKENFERIIIETNENISIIRKNIKTAETEIDTDNLTGCINLINKLDKNYMDRIQKLMYVKNLLI